MIPTGVLATLYGLASALSWGIGDFNGGIATRRASVYSIVFVGQVAGVILLLILAVVLREAVPSVRVLLLSGIMGFVGLVGILALYRGLAVGRMGIVAPLSALVGGVLPILVSIIQEGLPSALTLVGFALALVAVWLISGTGNIDRITRDELLYPLVAGVALSIFFIFIDAVSETAVLYPLVAARGTSLLALTVMVFAIRRESLPPASTLPFAVASGLFDAGGNVFFALATRVGRLDITTVLSSLYPAATVILAWLILRESLSRRQLTGVLVALAAIVMIAI
ncbi:MAG: DMT family transporter [Chloroflexota bacterium]